MSDIHEKVSEKTASTIRKEVREMVKNTGEAYIKGLVERGFRDKDIRQSVRDGVYDANFDLKK